MTTRCARGCAGQGCTGRYYTARGRLRRVVHYAFLVNKTIRLKHSTCKTSVGVKQDSNVWWKIFHFGTNLYGYITCFSSAQHVQDQRGVSSKISTFGGKFSTLAEKFFVHPDIQVRPTLSRIEVVEFFLFQWKSFHFQKKNYSKIT